jgi:hypothetical protein
MSKKYTQPWVNPATGKIEMVFNGGTVSKPAKITTDDANAFVIEKADGTDVVTVDTVSGLFEVIDYIKFDSSNNASFGYLAGGAFTTGLNNTLFGRQTGSNITSGTSNWMGGDRAGQFTTEGTQNFLAGDRAGQNITTGSFNVCLGLQAGINLDTGSSNIAIGRTALTLYTGNFATAIGYSALNKATGANNLAIGYFCGSDITTGSNNVLYGVQAGRYIADGIGNVALGYRSNYHNTGDYNFSAGYQAGYGVLNTSDFSHSINLGFQSGFLQETGTGNIFIGREAGYKPNNVIANATTTGAYQLFIGYRAGLGSSTQRSNVIALGRNALVDTDDACVIGGTGSDALNVGIGLTTPTARLHLPGGTATAGTAPLKFTDSTLNTTPEAGAMEFDGTGLHFTPVSDRRHVVLSNNPVLADVEVANTTTETEIYSTEITADATHVGQRFQIWLGGLLSTANSSDTCTIRVKVGGTTIASTTSVAANVTDEPWHVECSVQMRAIGASGSLVHHVDFYINDQQTGTASTSPVSIDTTTNNDIAVTIEWDNANASNSFKLTIGDTLFIN